MLLQEFDYPLPEELIAQQPLPERDASRMMVLHRASGAYEDRTFRDLPHLLQPGDLLVFNNTRVFPARLLGRRRGITAQPIGKNNPALREYLSAEVELLLTRCESDEVWQALVRPGRKIRTGEVLVFGDGELEAEVLARGDYGVRRVRLRARSGSIDGAIDRLGHVPLPPYIRRPDKAADRDAYQTVYAKVRGAVAAPTAGFHFSERVLGELRAQGIESCEITLHVGLGTFQPVHVAQVENHKMEAERFQVTEAAAEAIRRAQGRGSRVVAVGTTTVRTLEHIARVSGGRIVAGAGETSLFIVPGFQFQAAGALLTNFHLPKSTLLMLVSAFAGHDFVQRAYQHAVAESYRFYSYGDCMLIL
jgi:S-adenosylmethionine:tRNA ribosyltransferase-isomerase